MILFIIFMAGLVIFTLGVLVGTSLTPGEREAAWVAKDEQEAREEKGVQIMRGLLDDPIARKIGENAQAFNVTGKPRHSPWKTRRKELEAAARTKRKKLESFQEYV